MITYFFSDLDDILVHKVRPQDDTAIEVGNGFYIAETNLNMLKSLLERKTPGFGIVTSRRYSTAQAALNVIRPDYAVIDHGTIVIVKGETDREWFQQLKPYIGDPLNRDKSGTLWDYEAQVRAEIGGQGFEIYSDDRFGSFRVVPPPGNKENIERILQMRRPEGLDAIVIREAFVDFFPSMAGKANGVKRVLSQLGCSDYTLVAYAGDDVSDAAALVQFYPITTAEAVETVKDLTRARGGYITHEVKHEATRAIISHVEAMSAPDTPR